MLNRFNSKQIEGKEGTAYPPKMPPPIVETVVCGHDVCYVCVLVLQVKRQIAECVEGELCVC